MVFGQEKWIMTNDFQDKKIAIVCDWIKDWGGAEIVLTQLMELFPDADIYTSVFFQKNNTLFQNRNIHTSFIQKIPFLNTSHKLALLLRPQAFESFDLSTYDIVISSSSAESKWVITKPDCLHICYCHTPTRYFWSHYEEYLNMMEFGILNPLWKWLMPKLIKSLRRWDYAAAQRPDYFIANSQNTAQRIEKYYKRESEVIYPCLDLSEFTWPHPQPLSLAERGDFYLAVGRCIPYKKFDLLVGTFNENGKKLVIITNTDNTLYRHLQKISKANIEWKFNPSREKIIADYACAKAFIFPPEEDFWLVPLEAQAVGTPVIAFGKWWALETVTENTWVFFEEQTVESLNKTIENFEKQSFDYEAIKQHALKFDQSIFKKQVIDFIKDKLYNKKV